MIKMKLMSFFAFFVENIADLCVALSIGLQAQFFSYGCVTCLVVRDISVCSPVVPCFS